MYNLYLDKSEKFSAGIKIEGADSNNSKCRLILENNIVGTNIILYGSINNDLVEIPIPKLKNIFSENQIGMMKLEIIADDTFSIPWESQYQTKLSKKVTVEVNNKETNKDNKSIAITIDPIDKQLLFKRKLQENNITLSNLRSKIKIIESIVNEIGLTLDKDNLIELIIKNLGK